MLERLQRLTGWTGSGVFQAIFIAAAIIAATVTFLSITGVNPAAPFSGGVSWLLGVNVLLIGALAWLVVRRYWVLQTGGRQRQSGALIRRFLLLFSLSAVLPATFVAVFLGGTVTEKLDNWFDDRIETLVEQTADVARQNFDLTVTEPLQENAELMAFDLSAAVGAIETDPEGFADFLYQQVFVRQLLSAYVLDANGKRVSEPNPQPWDDFDAVSPPAADFSEAMAADTPLLKLLDEEAGFITALVRIEAEVPLYLYVLKLYNPEAFAQLRRAEQALIDYRDAKTLSARLQAFFLIGYTQIIALGLLLFARMGLEVAARVTEPIQKLARAARAIRDGDLNTRVVVPGSDDEIDVLAMSFNAMAAQLGDQRSALERSRSVSEDRRQFLETLLSEMSAGVIRTDDALQVTLANRSAEALVGKGTLLDRPLSDIAPEFQSFAIATVTEGIASDASVELEGDGERRHIRLRTSTDGAGGCVLTFDDATRLVSAQRQLAWRDVARRIAHEIRNPLTPILLSAERLKRRYRDTLKDDDVFQRSLETIMRQVGDIGNMVESFSNFARMPKPILATFNLDELLDEIAFAEGMVAPDVTISVSATDRPVSCTGDERLLRQVFANIIKNAVEAIAGMPTEAEVSGVISIELITGQDSHIIIVDDNGPGFPPERRDELLEPYVTTRDRGSGLGLAIVHRIVLDHSGSLSLQSRPNGARGARVQVVLPTASQIRDLDEFHHRELVEKVELQS